MKIESKMLLLYKKKNIYLTDIEKYTLLKINLQR
jgi:hypothetical protein